MKIIITSFILLASISSQAGTHFQCQEIYENKIARMTKNHNWRVAGKVAMVTGAAGVGTAVMALSFGASMALELTTLGVVLGHIPLTMISAGFGGMAIDALDREAGIIDAYSAQSLMFTPYSTVIIPIQVASEKKLIEDLIKLEIQLTYPDYVNTLFNEINDDRFNRGLPSLPIAQVIEIKKARMKDDAYRSMTIENAITASLRLVKEKGRVSKQMTYDEWREILVKNQEQFCSNGRAATLRQATLRISEIK